MKAEVQVRITGLSAGAAQRIGSEIAGAVGKSMTVAKPAVVPNTSRAVNAQPARKR